MAGARCGWPSADRRLITTVCPSIQPRSRKPCTKARASGEIGFAPTISAEGMTAWTNATTGRRAVNWARAANGHAAAALPIRVTNSRDL
jgi:hypothetical protein